MEFFDSNAADIVQHISLPLELAGFVLVVIEIYWPAKADRIESILDHFSSTSNWISSLRYIYAWTLRVILVLAVIAQMVIIYGLTQSPTHISSTESYRINIPIAFPIIIAVMLIASVIISVPDILRFLNRLTGGRALGSIGLILAFIGLLGEIYQIITLYVAP